ncbi:hypothetical protein ACFXQA_09855 [Microbacterium sp. P07]|uniref:hypothetical protein n=1 Tax=Microbacterium sp. P07 TaxID=3366952 RepID=UPI003745B9E8
MLTPTNDPIRADRRERGRYARETREALAARGAQPFQVVRKLQQQITDLRELVVRLPQVASFQTQAGGFGLAGQNGWRAFRPNGSERCNEEPRRDPGIGGGRYGRQHFRRSRDV